ncbi:hypothetical protein DIPPA_18601 [Diplonema papillatum]|nr:hypothetical protein DIPPA_18601 [Diplonema papillatum]
MIMEHEMLTREPTIVLEDYGNSLPVIDWFNTPREHALDAKQPPTPIKQLESSPLRRQDPNTVASKTARRMMVDGPSPRKRRAVRNLVDDITFSPLHTPLSQELSQSVDSYWNGFRAASMDSGAHEGFPSLPHNDTAASLGLPMNHFATTFHETRELGTGSFGRVVLAKHLFDGREYAVKISKKAVTGASDQHNKLREARSLSKCAGCPFIVAYHSCWVDEGHVHIQMEYCASGSLAALLAAGRGERWPDQRFAALVVQMGAAVHYLHSVARLVHLDIKPDNVFVAGPSSFKLGDFSLAAHDHSASSVAKPSFDGVEGPIPGGAPPKTGACAFPLPQREQYQQHQQHQQHQQQQQQQQPPPGFSTPKEACFSGPPPSPHALLPATLSQAGVQLPPSELSQASITSFQDGDPRFVPQDMLNEKYYPREADIFALGLTFYEVASGIPTPKAGSPDWAAVRENGVPAARLAARGMAYAHPLLAAMTQPEPSGRPSAGRLLQSFYSLWNELPTATSRGERDVDPMPFLTVHTVWPMMQRLLATKVQPSAVSACDG